MPEPKPSHPIVLTEAEQSTRGHLVRAHAQLWRFFTSSRINQGSNNRPCQIARAIQWHNDGVVIKHKTFTRLLKRISKE